MTVTVDCCSVAVLNKNYNPCYIIMGKKLIYHPSNSKKGFPIKGTNLRVEFVPDYGK